MIDISKRIGLALGYGALWYCAGAAAAFPQTVPTYKLSTVAGNGTSGYKGDGGAATSAELYFCSGVAVDAAGNIYIADQFNSVIRKVTAAGTISTIAGNNTYGYTGDGGAATSAQLATPLDVKVDAAGNVYIADTSNNVIRKVSTSGTISTVAGNNTAGYAGDGKAATSGELNGPSAIAFDAAGNLYIADTGNFVIRKVTTAGIISTVAGDNVQGFSGDNGAAVSAELNAPEGIAVDSAGNLYIGDELNNVVRKVSTSGIITTFAGNGLGAYSGDGGAATQAELNEPKGLAVDAFGNVFIADSGNSRVRVVSNGIISTVAVAIDNLSTDSDVFVTPAGPVYIADRDNSQIKLLTPVLQAPSILTNGVISASAFGGFPSVSPGGWIEIYGSNLALGTRGWGGADFSGVNAPTSLSGTSVTIGGVTAFVDFISAGQVNAQVPSGVATGPQSVIVTTQGGASAAATVTVNSVNPGLLAPTSFKIGGKQYVGALFTDGVTYVLPTGAVPGITSRPANPGETIVLYGVGFGGVTPSIAAGQIVQQSNTLAANLAMQFGDTPVAFGYAGLAPDQVGLYQFNVVVPSGASGTLPLTFTLGATQGTQTLYVAIAN